MKCESKTQTTEDGVGFINIFIKFVNMTPDKMLELEHMLRQTYVSNLIPVYFCIEYTYLFSFRLEMFVDVPDYLCQG